MFTDLFRKLQEPDSSRIGRMAERVAEYVLRNFRWLSKRFIMLPVVSDIRFSSLLTFCPFPPLHRGSINAQKQVDEYTRPQPFAHSYYLADEMRPRAFNSFTCMNSYFKGRAGGVGSSFKSARYYSEQARNRRAELVEQVAVSS